jgi:hypothetical protein
MKKAKNNKKTQEAEKKLTHLEDQKLENGKSITGGTGGSSNKRIGKGASTSAG